MKRVVAVSAVLVVMCCLAASSAFALHFTNVQLVATCDYYEITVSGVSWVPFTAYYTVTVESNCRTKQFTGSFAVPCDYSTNTFNTTYRVYWDNKLCGTCVISGNIELDPSKVEYESLFSSLGPTTVTCSCWCNLWDWAKNFFNNFSCTNFFNNLWGYFKKW